MIILWICDKTFKPFRGFRIELNNFLKNIEIYLLTKRHKYSLIKKGHNNREVIK